MSDNENSKELHWITQWKTRDDLVDVDCEFRRARLIAEGRVRPNRYLGPWLALPTFRLRAEDVGNPDPTVD